MKSLIAGMCMLLSGSMAHAAGDEPSAYLFAYFTGNRMSEEAVCYAVSSDGFNFKALNGGRPVLDSRLISSTGGVRDPHLLRGHDGDPYYYMVLTDMVSANGWDSNRAMVMLRSTDLVGWDASVVNIQKKFGQENLKRVWAPQTIYDADAGKYMVYWSMKHGDGPDIIYYAYANGDFSDIEGEPQPLFLPSDGKSCIDGDIVRTPDGTYHLFYKTEGHGNGIKVATTSNLTSGRWNEQPDYKQQTADAVEGAGVFRLIGSDRYILMYDVYTSGRYDFTESTDLRTFRKVSEPVTMDFHPRHGSVIQISDSELHRLVEHFGF
ncbi:MAG: glycoside hydrolase family 43 protein [Muribaculaceae bacterium]|nr:glycoside hydrolase family 43 protein [Muribaculaceae bacterium]